MKVQLIGKGVILLDEASLIGTQDMRRLFDVAGRVEARLILVGDRQQHRSVAAGELLKLLEERAGVPVAQVTEILRQTGTYRKATLAPAPVTALRRRPRSPRLPR